MKMLVSMILAINVALVVGPEAPAQSPEMIEKVVRELTLKRLEGAWVPDLLVTSEGAEKYPLAGRILCFGRSEDVAQGDGKGKDASGSFSRFEGNRHVDSGSFKVQDGYLRLTVKDRNPWDLEAGEAKDKLQYAYKVDDDVLTLCYTVGNKGKVDDLAPGKGKQVVIYRRRPEPDQATKPKPVKGYFAK
jgi:hypothetical protein